MGYKTDMFNSFCNKLNDKMTDLNQVLGQVQTDESGQQYYSDQTTDYSSYNDSQNQYSYQDPQTQYSYQDPQQQYLDQQQQQQQIQQQQMMQQQQAQYMYQQQQAQTLAPQQPSGGNSIMSIFNQSVNNINNRYDQQAAQLAQCQTPMDFMAFSQQQNAQHNMAMQVLYQGQGRPSKYWASNGDPSTW